MNVFIIGTPFETAQALDRKRLNKQIIECRQILKALNGQSKAWRNHPCTLQYKGHEPYLSHYMDCLEAFAAVLAIVALFTNPGHLITACLIGAVGCEAEIAKADEFDLRK